MDTCETHSRCDTHTHTHTLTHTHAPPSNTHTETETERERGRFHAEESALCGGAQDEMLAVPRFSQELLQDSRKGDPAFVEQRRGALETYLVQLLTKIEVLLECAHSCVVDV